MNTWLQFLQNPLGRRPAPRALPEEPVEEVPWFDASRYAFSNPGLEIAAIGDLHGRMDLLQRLVPELDALAATRRRVLEIYLGDYVDRGGDPRAVIEFLIDRGKRPDRAVMCLIGNHERWMLDALGDDERFVKWMQFGGDATIASYGVSPAFAPEDAGRRRAQFLEALPAAHVAFLQNLRDHHREGEFFFAHAGVRPGVPLDRQSPEDLMWIRQPFLGSFANFGAVVVHGHTPTRRPVLRANRIGIDTGAYQTGVLTCLIINSQGVRLIDTAPKPK